MEQSKHGECEQNVSDFNYENTLSEFDKSDAKSPLAAQKFGIRHLKNNIMSLTPEKTNEHVHTKHCEEGVELPKRYKMILDHFHGMICSLRLLRLRKKSPTFQNIRSQVEILAGRKLSYRDLAQIKYILPEAVQIDKILIHDEKTMCMKQDMKITLVFNVVEGHQEQSIFTALHKVFNSRLVNFHASHHEALDIPQSVLPEPFNQSIMTLDIPQSILPEPFNQSSITPTTDSLVVEPSSDSSGSSTEITLLNSSHLSSLFSRRISQKPVVETERSPLLASPVPLSSIKYDCKIKQNIEIGQHRRFPDSTTKATAIINPAHVADPQCCVNADLSKGTPLKLGLEDDTLMVETPAQMTPKKSAPSSDDNPKTSATQKQKSCNTSAKRSLDFSNFDGQKVLFNSTFDELEQHELGCDSLPQMVDAEGIVIKENVCYLTETIEKPQTSGLSGLVPLIYNIFQSTNSSSVTKEELVHKIIMNNCDIVESRDVEKQLELLEKLVPDWICRKLVSSGDLLYSIEKVSDLNTISERLVSI